MRLLLERRHFLIGKRFPPGQFLGSLERRSVVVGPESLKFRMSVGGSGWCPGLLDGFGFRQGRVWRHLSLRKRKKRGKSNDETEATIVHLPSLYVSSIRLVAQGVVGSPQLQPPSWPRPRRHQ